MSTQQWLTGLTREACLTLIWAPQATVRTAVAGTPAGKIASFAQLAGKALIASVYFRGTSVRISQSNPTAAPYVVRCSIRWASWNCTLSCTWSKCEGDVLYEFSSHPVKEKVHKLLSHWLNVPKAKAEEEKAFILHLEKNWSTIFIAAKKAFWPSVTCSSSLHKTLSCYLDPLHPLILASTVNSVVFCLIEIGQIWPQEWL